MMRSAEAPIALSSRPASRAASTTRGAIGLGEHHAEHQPPAPHLGHGRPRSREPEQPAAEVVTDPRRVLDEPLAA